MRDSSDQKVKGAEHANDKLNEFDIEISDLPPDRRSHFLLLKLADVRRRGQTFVRAALHTFAADVKDSAEVSPGEDEQFALEISDLPPSTRSHFLLLRLLALKARVRALLPFRQRLDSQQRAPLTRAQRRLRIGRALTALGLCAVLLLLLAGNVPDLRARLLTVFQPSTPAPAATSAPVHAPTSIFSLGQGVPIIVERHGQALSPAQGTPGPLPTFCPQASTLQSFMTPLDPPGVGGGPVWLSGFVGPTAALVDLQPLGTSLSHPQGQAIGWYEGLAVFIQRGFNGKITLRGESQGPGGLVFFAGDNILDFAPALTLDSNAFRLESAPSGTEWLVTSINIIVPFAGCYTLTASWSDGSWSEYFAAGN